MDRAIPIFVLFLLGFARTATADGPATTQPVPQAAQVSALFKQLHPGMSLHESLGLAQTALGGSWGKIIYGRETGISRHALDGESSVILEFSVNGGDEVLTSFALATFSDLKPKIPDGLYDAVRLIHLSPSVRGSTFEPTALIRAVNGLLPLGKEKALAACVAYTNLSRDVRTEGKYGLDEQRVFLILRLLFVNSNGDPQMPWMRIGGTSPQVRPGDADWPLFPLVLVNDTPFCLSGGYRVGGQPQSPLTHVQYCQQDCVLRHQPLTPSDSPLNSVDSITHSDRWARLASDERERSQTEYRLRMQALRAVDPSLANASGNLDPALIPKQQTDQTWNALKQDETLRNVTWASDRFAVK